MNYSSVGAQLVIFIYKWNKSYPPLLPSRSASRPWFAGPKTVTRPSICLGGRELNPRPSSRESNALTTRLPSHHLSEGMLFCPYFLQWAALPTSNLPLPMGRSAPHDPMCVTHDSLSPSKPTTQMASRSRFSRFLHSSPQCP